MKAVIDTNVVISGIIGAGPPARIIDAWHASEFEWVFSTQLIRELDEVTTRTWFQRRSGWDDAERHRFIDLLSTRATIVEPATRVRVVEADPDDDVLFATAIAGGAECIVTGDRQVLRVSSYAGIQIITPRDFAALLRARR